MPNGKIDGIAVASIVGGTVLAYAGITGKSILTTIRDVVSGKSPAKDATAYPIQGTGNPNAVAQNGANIAGASVNGTAIAQDAVQYVGHAYVYGGAPGPSGTSGWDCSSFVNWVLDHDIKMSIPGYGPGQWNPSTHGPATGSYSGFGTTIARASVQAGDLCLWATHIGIALNNTQMISALNPSLGTQITGIEDGGPQGESLTCHRVAG